MKRISALIWVLALMGMATFAGGAFAQEEFPPEGCELKVEEKDGKFEQKLECPGFEEKFEEKDGDSEFKAEAPGCEVKSETKDGETEEKVECPEGESVE